MLILLFIFSISTASAATLQVDSKHYKTIQSAINAANSGDTIKVAPGVYKEHVLIEGKTLTIKGLNYPQITGVNFQYGGNGGLYDFKIVNGGVVCAYSGSNIIKNCDFKDSGLSIVSCPENQIINNKFTNGVLSLWGSQENIITGNYITESIIGLNLYNSSCTKCSKNTFSYCQIAVLLDAPPGDWMTRNKYIHNTENIRIQSY
jgi:parallel beta-helix repeat protein